MQIVDRSVVEKIIERSIVDGCIIRLYSDVWGTKKNPEDWIRYPECIEVDAYVCGDDGPTYYTQHGKEVQLSPELRHAATGIIEWGW